MRKNSKANNNGGIWGEFFSAAAFVALIAGGGSAFFSNQEEKTDAEKEQDFFENSQEFPYQSMEGDIKNLETKLGAVVALHCQEEAARDFQEAAPNALKEQFMTTKIYSCLKVEEFAASNAEENTL